MQENINIVLPEIVLAVYSMAALMFAVYGGKDRLAGTILWVTAFVLFGIGAWIFLEPAGRAVVTLASKASTLGPIMSKTKTG